MAHEFCWIEMTTDNPGAAREFYTSLFDWSFDEMEMAQGGTYAMFQPAGGGPGGGLMAKPAAEVPTAWTPYVAVDDLAAACSRVRRLGGQVLMDQTPVPGHGAFAIIADPTGAVLGLWKNEVAAD